MAKLNPVRCPECQKRYRLPASFENRKVVCKRCQHQFLVGSGGATSAPPDGDGIKSLFDSLDMDDLLNAPTSGLEKSKLTSKEDSEPPQQEGKKRLAVKRPDPKTTGNDQKNGRHEGQTGQNEASVKGDPDPDLIEKELEFAWAKKKNDKKQAADRQRAEEAERVKSEYGGANKHAELDDEELAIYRAVTRQNFRRNLVWGLIAACVAVVLSGFYANAEYQLLVQPLSQDERDWLTERGFVLKASKNSLANGEAGDGALVIVANGRSFADVDQFAPRSEDPNQDLGLANELDQGRDNRPAMNDQRRNERRPHVGGNRRKARGPGIPLPKVDFDTNVIASTLESVPVGAVQQFPSSGIAVAAFSPRGHAYLADRQFIKGVSADGDVFDQRTMQPSNQTATAIVASPDGRHVVVGNDRGIVRAYQVDAKGRLSESWKLKHIHRDKIIHLRISQDSKLLVVYSADGRLSIWDIEKQLIESNLSDLVPESRLTSFQLTSDAIVIGSSEGLRRIRIGQSKVELVAFDKRYRLVAAQNTGEHIVVSDGKSLNAIDAATKKIKWAKTIRIANRGWVEFSPDGETAFYYDGGRYVLHFQISSGDILKRYGDDRVGFVSDVVVSPDGKQLFASGVRNTSHLYQVQDANDVTMPTIKAPLAAPDRAYPPSVPAKAAAAGQKAKVVAVASARVADQEVEAVCLSNNGFLIAAVKGRTIVYDWTTGRIAYERFDSGVEDEVNAMTTIGKKLLLGRWSGAIEVFEIESDGKLGSFKRIAGQLAPIKFMTSIPETTLVASVANSGETRVWDINTNETIYTGNPINSSVQSVAVDRRSDLLLADGDELVTLDYRSGSVKRKKGDVRVQNATILPDGKRLAFFDRGKFKLATTSRGEINLSVDLPKRATGVSFSPDSKLAFLFADGMVFVYRLRGGKEVFSFPVVSDRNGPTEMVFSADKKFMMPFSRGSRGSFKIYATPTP